MIPNLQINLYNAWIFMIWPLISPILSKILIKNKEVSKKIRTSVPMKHEKTLNIISNFTIILAFIYSIFLPIKIDTIYFYIGLTIFTLGLIIDLSVIYTLRKTNLDKPFTNGIYKYSRHPIYISIILIITSITIMSLSLVFTIILIILTIHMLLAAPAEEKYCIKKYGKIYKDYQKNTPRWMGIPKKIKN